jgi:hypothetical protein
MEDEETASYADGEILELKQSKIPRWLKWVYLIVPLVGLLWLGYFWQGSRGQLDRGHWKALQQAAETTKP